jgi:hypothetical protein
MIAFYFDGSPATAIRGRIDGPSEGTCAIPASKKLAHALADP